MQGGRGVTARVRARRRLLPAAQRPIAPSTDSMAGRRGAQRLRGSPACPLLGDRRCKACTAVGACIAACGQALNRRHGKARVISGVASSCRCACMGPLHRRRARSPPRQCSPRPRSSSPVQPTSVLLLAEIRVSVTAAIRWLCASACSPQI